MFIDVIISCFIFINFLQFIEFSKLLDNLNVNVIWVATHNVLRNVYTLDLTNCYNIIHISMLKKVHILNLIHCDKIININMLFKFLHIRINTVVHDLHLLNNILIITSFAKFKLKLINYFYSSRTKYISLVFYYILMCDDNCYLIYHLYLILIHIQCICLLYYHFYYLIITIV